VADGSCIRAGLGQVWANDVRTGKLLWSYDAQIKFPMGSFLVGLALSRGAGAVQDKVLRRPGLPLDGARSENRGELWEVHPCEPKDHKPIPGTAVGAGKGIYWQLERRLGIGRGYVDALTSPPANTCGVSLPFPRLQGL